MLELVALDHHLFQLINHTWSHPLFDAFFPFWTDFHKTPVFQFFLLPLLLVVIYRRGGLRGFAMLAIGLCVMAVCDVLASEVLKPIFVRPRPEASNLPFEVILRGARYGGFSFPSSHAADAFGLAAFFAFYFRSLRLPLFVAALCMAYSRVYCGVHFPSDVFGGTVLGLLVGLSLARLMQRWSPALLPQPRSPRGQKSR